MLSQLRHADPAHSPPQTMMVDCNRAFANGELIITPPLPWMIPAAVWIMDLIYLQARKMAAQSDLSQKRGRSLTRAKLNANDTALWAHALAKTQRDSGWKAWKWRTKQKEWIIIVPSHPHLPSITPPPQLETSLNVEDYLWFYFCCLMYVFIIFDPPNPGAHAQCYFISGVISAQ